MFRPCFRIIQKSSRYITQVKSDLQSRTVHCSSCRPTPRHSPKTPTPAISTKYQILDESTAQVIHNTAEELPDEHFQILADEFDGVNLNRGKTGVYDIEDLVSLLQRENAQDIFVATVPREINYVDYICIVSGKSTRHMFAMAEFVRRVYKQKCRRNDYIPRLEGRHSEEWMAVDLGNIALHIFSAKIRTKYDLETLWAVGPEYDEILNAKEDKVNELLENYATFLKDLKPME